jgi:hypothetical protein
MVGLCRPGEHRGIRGKLTGDDRVNTAAVALLHGFDPLTFMGYGPEDLRIAIAVLKRAQEIRSQHEQNLADYVSSRTAGLTASQITRWLGNAVPKWFRR